MISSARSRLGAPSASAVSASASRWSAPVRSAPAPSAIPAAAAGGSGPASAAATPPTAAPIPAPTSGKRAPARATSSPPSSTRRPTGIRVRKASAATSARSSLAAGIRDSGLAEGRHLLEDGQAGLHDRKHERRAAPLAEPELELDERAQAEGVQHERVPWLGRAMRGDQPAGGGRREPHGYESRGSGDEAVEQDGPALRRAAEDEAGQERDL